MDRKRLIVGGVVVALLALGGGAAFAAQQDQEEEEAPIAGSSVTAPEESGEENEAAESDLAGINRIAARGAALDAVPGEIRDSELENEDGFVVYEVEVASEDGGLYEVIVDAGNSEVVGLEAEAEEGPEGAD